MKYEPECPEFVDNFFPQFLCDAFISRVCLNKSLTNKISLSQSFCHECLQNTQTSELSRGHYCTLWLAKRNSAKCWFLKSVQFRAENLQRGQMLFRGLSEKFFCSFLFWEWWRPPSCPFSPLCCLNGLATHSNKLDCVVLGLWTPS